MQNNLQQRIGYTGDLDPILSKVCEVYNLGNYLSYSVIEMGYEDFNIIITTNRDKYFIKIFAAFRDKQDCQRYVEIIKNVQSAGIHHPKLYGDLYEVTIGNTSIRLIVTEYINGLTLFDSPGIITEKETKFLIQQAAMINQVAIKPPFVYDSWAIVNFLKEAERKMQFLLLDDKKLIHPVLTKFKALDLKVLPHCFVHGDIIKTNVMRDNQGKLYVLDFSVANYYPRIQELAVLLCDVLFDKNQTDKYDTVYKQTVAEYQNFIKLDKLELEILPLYIESAHAMHLLSANYEKVVNNNNSKENDYFLKLGKAGLQFTADYFHN